MDASLGGKWVLKDEEDSKEALTLLERYVVGDVKIIVPDLFFYEIGNALLVAVRRKRVPEATALEALQALMNLHLQPVPVGPMAASALTLGLRLGLSFYDAAYLAVAESHGVPLVTADSRLLGAGLPWVVGLDTI